MLYMLQDKDFLAYTKAISSKRQRNNKLCCYTA